MWLIETVDSQPLTRQQISYKWERSSLNDNGKPLSKKTFYNHVDAVEEIFNLRIRCRNKRKGSTYYIENGEDVDDSSNLTRWMIDTISVSNRVSESRELCGRILYEEIPSGQEFLLTIIEAMKENKALTMTYEGFSGKPATTFPVEPYLVKVFRRRWYLVAKSRELDKLRMYALDRIRDIDILDGGMFEMPEDFSAEAYFSEYFGVIHDESYSTETVRIKVNGLQYRYLETLPLHRSQKEVEKGDGYTIFEYRLKPTYDFIQEIFSRTEDSEVLSPGWLREEIAGKVERMARLYNPLSPVPGDFMQS